MTTPAYKRLNIVFLSLCSVFFLSAGYAYAQGESCTLPPGERVDCHSDCSKSCEDIPFSALRRGDCYRFCTQKCSTVKRYTCDYPAQCSGDSCTQCLNGCSDGCVSDLAGNKSHTCVSFCSVSCVIEEQERSDDSSSLPGIVPIPGGIKNWQLILSTDVFGGRVIPLGERGLAFSQTIFKNIFRTLFALAGTWTVILFAVYGTQLIYAQMRANVQVISDAKGKLFSTITGIIILLLSWVILNFVSPSLLRPDIFRAEHIQQVIPVE